MHPAKLLLSICLLLPVLNAQIQMRPVQAHTVSATGDATLNAKPDQARILIGVTTQAQTADEAVRQNAVKAANVSSTLKPFVGAEGEIKTANYSVNPQYRYPQGEAPILVGYQANNTVEVLLNDLTLMGKLIDAVSKAGANNVDRIEFLLKQDQAARTEVIGKAANQARANAEAIAKALGLTVRGVFSAETLDAGVPRPLAVPMAMQMRAVAKEAPTPIEAGTIEIRASVTVTLEVGP
jgi:uncharacterized protein YggE